MIWNFQLFSINHALIFLQVCGYMAFIHPARDVNKPKSRTGVSKPTVKIKPYYKKQMQLGTFDAELTYTYC